MPDAVGIVAVDGDIPKPVEGIVVIGYRLTVCIDDTDPVAVGIVTITGLIAQLTGHAYALTLCIIGVAGEM